jgi:hypothetical protein
MIISLSYARRMVSKGVAVDRGTVISDGWRWMVLDRLDLQRTDHARIERA